jgi:endonuclease YncB( thermonuclease family)
MEFELYNYSNTPYFTLNNTCTYARLVDIHDGDTITVIIFIFNHPFKFHLRLAGIDTCEINNKHSELKIKAMQARNRVLQLATNNAVSTYKCSKTKIILEDIKPKKEINCDIRLTVLT